MGAPPEDNNFHRGNENPQIHVNIDTDFLMAKYEVTLAEYKIFVKETNHIQPDGCIVLRDEKWEFHNGYDWLHLTYPQKNSHPVSCVSWNDAKAYTAWLSQKAKHPYRLPTEAEWAYAARAGVTTRYYWGDHKGIDGPMCEAVNVMDTSLTDMPDYSAWRGVSNCSDGYPFTSPVGAFPPNKFGVYDMIGNLWEWTEDCYAATLSQHSKTKQAHITPHCKERVLRGGTWANNWEWVRLSIRHGSPADTRSESRTIRVVRNIKGIYDE